MERGERIPAIITPFWDAFCAGGASIAGMVLIGVAALGFGFEFDADGSLAVALVVAINLPHFMASYPMLYASKHQVKSHRFASLYVPALLLGILAAVVADVNVGYSAPLVSGLTAVGVCYLAWHYTGQAWGVMSTFAVLAGLRFERDEKLLIRGGLQLLLVYHFVYALGLVQESFTWLLDERSFATLHRGAMEFARPLAALGSGLGLFGLCLVKSRGKPLSVRVLIPWLAIQLWYPFYTLVVATPFGFIWVQVSHALQYLLFPVRVNANRRTNLEARNKLVVLAVDYALWVFIGVALMKSMAVFSLFAGEAYRMTPYTTAVSTSLVMVINIHHYFIDGVIWKLRNPEVRRELMAHISRVDEP